jgi:hypothetical protein
MPVQASAQHKFPHFGGCGAVEALSARTALVDFGFEIPLVTELVRVQAKMVSR